MNPDHLSSEERYHTLIIQNSQENSEIKTLLQAQKYHQRLSLTISLNQQTKIAQIGECLSKLNHLSGLHITVMKNSIGLDNSLEDVLKPLKSFQSLKDFKFEMNSQSNHSQNQEMSRELAQFLYSQLQLQKLFLYIPNYDHINQQGQGQIQNAFQNLKCLKELRLFVKIDDQYPQNGLNEILGQINQLKTLTSFILVINNEVKIKVLERPHWQFDKLNDLKELTIASEFSQQQVSILNDQLRNLQSLIKFKIEFKKHQEIQVNELLNTLFNLKNLEELIISLNTDINNISLTIGDSVCSQSQLKVLKIEIFRSFFYQKKLGTIVFGKEIQNIKHLEKLYFHFDSCLISDESFEVLSIWKDQWKKLVDLSLVMNQVQIEFIEFVSDNFCSVKSLQKLKTLFNYSLRKEKTNFLNGLAQLNNLESLTIYRLYQEYNQNIENQYIECFQNLQSLRELKLWHITYSKEISCLGQSLQFMIGLTCLTVKLSEIAFLENFDIFCKNLKLLQSLKYLDFAYEVRFGGDHTLMKVQDTEVLLQSISALKGLKSLLLFAQIQEVSKSVYKKEICSLAKQLCQLHTLRHRYTNEVTVQNGIRRHCLRLVNLRF